jgi:hypothetical protein
MDSSPVDGRWYSREVLDRLGAGVSGRRSRATVAVQPSVMVMIDLDGSTVPASTHRRHRLLRRYRP